MDHFLNRSHQFNSNSNVYDEICKMSEKVKKMDERLSKLGDVHDAIFEVNDRMKGIEEQLSKLGDVNDAILKVNDRMKGIEEQLSKWDDVSDTVLKVSERLKKMEERMGKMECTVNEFTQVNRREEMNTIGDRLNIIEAFLSIDANENTINNSHFQNIPGKIAKMEAFINKYVGEATIYSEISTSNLHFSCSIFLNCR